ncbi:amino acid adenylation domain-containing protein (plasmid) [Streptomyces sp. R39]|uniref:Amino acid adenylation domain-containing protein n=1 Tax=Streptomyces sp. R39 TaxID=3238631 RepID=A0AB39R6Q7_9ACTN
MTIELLPCFRSMESLVEILRHQAAATPNVVALTSADKSLTYHDLDVASDKAARQLIAAGVRPGQLTGLLVGRDLESIVALLAVLKCGAAYVPLDPEYPRNRILFIAEDSQVSFIIGERATAESFGLLDHRFIDRDVFANKPEPDSGAPLPTPAPQDAAYVIYTSGSTGQPKGCVIPHSSVLALLEGALPLFQLTSSDRWAVFHSLCFDFSVWELWGALSTGATAVLVPWETALSPGRLVEFLRTEEITVLNQVPSVFRYTAQAHARSRHPRLSLRYVVFGGEPVNLKVVEGFVNGFTGQSDHSAPRLINMYGITENTVHSTFKELDAATLAAGVLSPIGRPLPHVGAHILDEDHAPVSDGTVGELWLSGPGLSAGYLHRDDLNRERFRELVTKTNGPATRCYRTGDLVRRLPDGELDYVGRNDDQAKIRGFRIELREIEAALTAHPKVKDAAVVVMDTKAGATLLAWLESTEPSSKALFESVRTWLSEILPGYMVPYNYRIIERIPLTPSGKRDRNALSDMASHTL